MNVARLKNFFLAKFHMPCYFDLGNKPFHCSVFCWSFPVCILIRRTSLSAFRLPSPVLNYQRNAARLQQLFQTFREKSGLYGPNEKNCLSGSEGNPFLPGIEISRFILRYSGTGENRWIWNYGCTSATNQLGLPAAEIARHLGVTTASINKAIANLDKTRRL